MAAHEHSQRISNEPASPTRDSSKPTLNRTGMPDRLKSGVERLSGMSLDDVRVTYNSPEPRRFGADAYTAGSRIHLGPKGRDHLAHEAWHVVQQRQGRVRRTARVAGAPVNDDDRLEREADEFGVRAGRIQRKSNPDLLDSPRSPSPTVIQRFKTPNGKDGGDVRESENGRILRVGEHRLYVDPALVDEANATLANTGGGEGSFLELHKMKNDLRGKLQRTVPIVRQRPTGLLRSQSPRKTFLEQPLGTYQSPADCHVAAQTVMGSDDVVIGSYGSEQPRMAMPDEPSANFDAEDQGGAHIALRAKHTFFARAMPAFGEILRDHILIDEPEFGDAYRAIAAVDPSSVEFGENNAWSKVYRELILPVPALRRLFAATFRVNEHAEPAVGRAFTNVNDESQKYTQEKQGEDIWNFHWAGIVLVDGNDYVTLENLSTENINELNERWYFQMYGRGRQSFHAASLEDSHATPAAITLGVDTTTRAELPERNLKPTKNQRMVLHWLNDPANDHAALADLDACPLPFGRPREQLYGICDKLFGYSKAEVDVAKNFEMIQRDIRKEIVDSQLATEPPAVKKKPVLLNLPPGGVPPNPLF